MSDCAGAQHSLTDKTLGAVPPLWLHQKRHNYNKTNIHHAGLFTRFRGSTGIDFRLARGAAG